MKTHSKTKFNKRSTVRNRSAISKPRTAKVNKAVNNAPSRGVSILKIIDRVNSWRENYNPTVHLTMQRARYLVESYPRGEFADLMWTFGAPFTGIENADPDMIALLERRSTPILEMDWNIKIRDDVPEESKNLAQEQSDFLRGFFENIDNLYEAIEHLTLAPFRGFSHLEKQANPDGDLHLEILDQWNVVRDGLYGQWKYNPEARQCGFKDLPDKYILDPANFIIRVVRRPIGRIALVKFIRQNLSQKDWDAFIEIYGIPGGVVTGPANVDPAKEAEYESAAEKVATGGSGYLPNGSNYIPNDSPRGVNPFRDHLRYLTEQLILAGTGGLLTMLTESGSGTLGGNAHTETFKTICRGEARRISEILQTQLALPEITKRWALYPSYAYFELAANEEVNVGDITKQALDLSQAGYQIDPKELSEKTSYKLTLRPQTATAAAITPTSFPNRKLKNAKADEPELGKLKAKARDLLTQATAEDLQPLRDRIAKALKAGDNELISELKKIEEELPQIFEQTGKDSQIAKALEGLIGAALVSGLTTKPEESK